MKGIGKFDKTVVFQDPGDPVPDGVGGYTQTWQDLTPATWKVQIQPQPVGDLERTSAGGSVVTTATHVVRGWYHPGVSTKTRMLYRGQTFSITGARTNDEGEVTMELAAVEQVTP